MTPQSDPVVLASMLAKRVADEETTPLTIDTRGLADAWLPLFKSERESSEYMEKAVSAACGTPSYRPLLTAFAAIRVQYCETVECIRERGGLLHCI